MALGLNCSGINGKEGMGKKGVLSLRPLRTGCQDMDKHTMILLKEILIRENGKGARKDWESYQALSKRKRERKLGGSILDHFTV